MDRTLPWVRAIFAHLLTALTAIAASLYLISGMQNGAHIMSFSPEMSILRFIHENEGLSDEELTPALREFDEELMRAAEAFSQKHDVILLRDSEILSGAQDATPYILDKMSTEGAGTP